MKILFSLTYYTPYVSGLTLYVKRLTGALARKPFVPQGEPFVPQDKGHQISVICFQHEKTLRTHEAIAGVKVYRAKPLLKISKGFLSFDWILLSWRLVRQHDAIVVNLPQFEGIVLALWAKIFGKKLISLYHCEVVLPPSWSNKLIELILKLSHLVTLCLSDVVITYTEDFAKHSPGLSPFRGKIKYIYPPISKPKVNKRVQKIIRDKIGDKHAYTIGIAARLAAEKGIEYVLEAIPRIDGKVKVVIAGSLNPVGEEEYKRKILHLVQKYKNYVVFLGELKEEDMGSFYSLLDVLVLPSVNSTEAFGMVQVEAMMMGVPVVATDLPGVRVPIQESGMGILVPSGNSQKLGEAIVEILKNKKKYIKKKKVIEKEFAFEKTVKFYENQL